MRRDESNVDLEQKEYRKMMVNNLTAKVVAPIAEAEFLSQRIGREREIAHRDIGLRHT